MEQAKFQTSGRYYLGVDRNPTELLAKLRETYPDRHFMTSIDILWVPKQ